MQIRKILYCTDFSENAEAAFVYALEMAGKYQAGLDILHVLPPVLNPILTDTEWVVPEEPVASLISKIEERMQQVYGERVGENIESRLVVLDGHVSSEIIRYARENDVDLIVMGSYGLSGMGLVFFGSVANRVAHKAPCSVMIIRRKEK